MAEVRGAAGGAGLARVLGVSTFPALVMIVPASARRADSRHPPHGRASQG
jgi:hypothetical protein